MLSLTIFAALLHDTKQITYAHAHTLTLPQTYDWVFL